MTSRLCSHVVRYSLSLFFLSLVLREVWKLASSILVDSLARRMVTERHVEGRRLVSSGFSVGAPERPAAAVAAAAAPLTDQNLPWAGFAQWWQHLPDFPFLLLTLPALSLLGNCAQHLCKPSPALNLCLTRCRVVPLHRTLCDDRNGLTVLTGAASTHQT